MLTQGFKKVRDDMAKFPTYEQMGKKVAEKALDEYLINGKTLREWVKIIAEQEPRTGHWIYDKSIENWKCSECDETPKTLGYVGSANFMREHFKYCNHCGARMSEVSE